MQHVTAHLIYLATALHTSNIKYEPCALLLEGETERPQDLIDFFSTAIMYYMRLPTYEWLAKSGITPSNTTTYTLSDMQAALTDGHGPSEQSQPSVRQMTSE
jgi:hypothetical protein